MTRRVLAAVVIVVVLSLSLAGCGVGGEGEATGVAPADVPFRLLEPPEDEPQPARAAPGARAVLYLVRDDRLFAVERPVDGPLTLAKAMDALADGPTPEEQSVGITSHLPAGGGAAAVTARDGVAIVELRRAVTEVAPEEQRLAIAQLVYTLTEVPGVGRVAFTLDDEPVEVPTGEGRLSTDSVSRDAFPYEIER